MNVFLVLYQMAVEQPLQLIESVATFVIPLILVALMFVWRVKQSMKKQKKIAKRKEKMLKKMSGSHRSEEDDEVINEAIRLMEEKAKKLN